MPASYSVVQYVPDPIANERINVGVIVLGNGIVYSRFLRSWDRVTRFAQDADLSDVQDFVSWVTAASVDPAHDGIRPRLADLDLPTRLDERALRDMIADWSNSIQLTPLQPSLEAPEALLTNSAAIFLRESTIGQPAFRNRRDAANLAVREVRGAVERRLGKHASRQFVKSGLVLGGKVMPRLPIDLAVTNGQVHVASRALSFEMLDMSELDRQARDAVHILDDVRELLAESQTESVEIVLVALPPSERHEARPVRLRFEETLEACRRINAQVVTEPKTREWAEHIAELVEAKIAPHESHAAWG